MSYMENGSRYTTVLEMLALQPDIIVVGSSKTDKVDGRKGVFYDEVSISIAPKFATLTNTELARFTEGLLPNLEPLFRHDGKSGRLRTFDKVGEKEFRTVSIQVFPSVSAAESGK